jgi:hypothetical protein
MMLKNITLSAERALIERARQRAEQNNTTLNSEFRRWLAKYVEIPQTTSDLVALMNRFSYVKNEKTFTRDELNER